LSSRQVKQLQRLERLGKHLKGNVQPRLAWEVALLDLCA
ncbi:MAG: DNA polymerase III subunit delta', partial [Synechococcaceae bacterium WBB_34_004]|nr:DNA polymerase III subunit delta' [Synechococcaceae bacterium WBB_34_004]